MTTQTRDRIALAAIALMACNVVAIAVALAAGTLPVG